MQFIIFHNDLQHKNFEIKKKKKKKKLFVKIKCTNCALKNFVLIFRRLFRRCQYNANRYSTKATNGYKWPNLLCIPTPSPTCPRLWTVWYKKGAGLTSLKDVQATGKYTNGPKRKQRGLADVWRKQEVANTRAAAAASVVGCVGTRVIQCCRATNALLDANITILGRLPNFSRPHLRGFLTHKKKPG